MATLSVNTVSSLPLLGLTVHFSLINVRVTLTALIFSFIFNAPAYSQGLQSQMAVESQFVELIPPSQFSYMKGSVKRFTESNKRYIVFSGTTAMPTVFTRMDGTTGNPMGISDSKILTGRWIWEYKVDCDDLTYDRASDGVSWRPLRFDPTAIAMAELFCPDIKWSTLPVI